MFHIYLADTDFLVLIIIVVLLSLLLQLLETTVLCLSSPESVTVENSKQERQFHPQTSFPRSKPLSAFSLQNILHVAATKPVGFNSAFNELHTCVPGWLPFTQWEEARGSAFLLHLDPRIVSVSAGILFNIPRMDSIQNLFPLC